MSFDPHDPGHGDFLDRLDAAVMARDGKPERGEIRFRCPAGTHEDNHPSARWNRPKALWRCDVCQTGAGALDLADRLGVEKPNRRGRSGGGGNANPVKGATVQPLADAKRLPAEELRTYGLFEVTYSGAKAVAIPYHGVQPGQTVATRYRVAIDGPDRFRWKKGDHPALYGLWRLADARDAGWALVVEGESDCWTAWHHGIPCVGIPGKAAWKPEWASHLAGLDLVIWQEPDAADFTRRIGETVPGARVIVAPVGTKDISDAHVRGDDVAALIGRLRRDAPLVADVLDKERQARLTDLRRGAASVLDEPDPLPLIERGIRALGYGGDIKPPLVTYLAVTTRLLGQRAGTMPAHLLLIGPASAGKSYTASVVLRLMPPEAKAEIDAGSPRVLIYDDTDLRHRALVFGEADSLPAGEDNPAASAVRTLLQEGHVSYKVVIKDPEGGGYVVRTIDRPGPTVLLTTAVRSLGPQLSTRLFALDIPDDAHQVRAALAAQGAIEEDGAVEASTGLIAFQAYLQAAAPWDVTVPFARRLGELIGETHLATRVLRDFQRLLSLVKAVTILRHGQRQRDAKGRLVATVEDYEAVKDLVNHLYAATVSGGSLAIRDTVAAVVALVATTEQPSALDVAKQLGIHKSTATRRINKAIGLGWLINEEDKRAKPYRLAIGDPMPDDVGLPAPDLLRGDGCTVAADTGRTTAPHSATATSAPPSPEPPTPAHESVTWVTSDTSAPTTAGVDDLPHHSQPSGTNGKVRADVDLGPARESIATGDPVKLGQDLEPVAQSRGRSRIPKVPKVVTTNVQEEMGALGSDEPVDVPLIGGDGNPVCLDCGGPAPADLEHRCLACRDVIEPEPDTTEPTRPCRNCGGTGQTTVSMNGETSQRPCGACDGSGAVVARERGQLDGGPAVIVQHCAVDGRMETPVRSFRVGEVPPCAKYPASVRISFVAPRKRGGASFSMEPDNIRYLTIETEGRVLYDSRADVPCDMAKWEETNLRFQNNRGFTTIKMGAD